MPTGEGIPISEAVPMLADALEYYDKHDVKRWFQRYRKMTGHPPKVYQSMIDDCRTFKKVPNEAFRQVFAKRSEAMVLGVPTKHGSAGNHSGVLGTELNWIGLLREEFIRLGVGPKDLTTTRMTSYLYDVLGTKVRTGGSGGTSLAWLMQYEIAEAFCKTFGMTPINCGI